MAERLAKRDVSACYDPGFAAGGKARFHFLSTGAPMDTKAYTNDISGVVEADRAHVWHHLSQHKHYETIDPRVNRGGARPARLGRCGARACRCRLGRGSGR